MKKVDYPIGVNYEQLYLTVFVNEIGKMRSNWSGLRNGNLAELGFLPDDVEEILKAPYSVLVGWFVQFMYLPKIKRDALNPRLRSIFDYEAWRNDIAEYFKNPKNGFKITSCHYCDMAYINVYKVDPNADALYFLNFAPDDELQKLTKSVPRIEYIKKQRPYKSKADYDRVASQFRWSVNKWHRTFKTNDRYRHHFDLDHVLPRSEFGLAGLSLYNLVPSCQICNQKLKKTRVLGVNAVPKDKLSPSSPLFDFNHHAEFHLLPRPGVKAGKLSPSLNPQDYELQLNAIDPDYDNFIKLFKLEERYQQHKRIALHWLEMKYKYTDSRIKMMAASLNHPSFSYTRIKSDIFQNTLYGSNIMSFEKLRDDMLK